MNSTTHFFRKIIAHALVLTILLVPGLSFAQIEPPTGSLLPCPNGYDCTFNDFGKLINTVVDYFFYIVILACVIAFIYAGFLLVTSGANEGNRQKAIKLFTSIGKGILWLVGGYLLIKIIVDGLVKPNEINNII